MAVHVDREHFIPFRRADVVRMCLEDGRLSPEEQASFDEFRRILEALYHFTFHQKLETLKECYAPFNPDQDTRPRHDWTDAEKRSRQKQLVGTLEEILVRANFRRATPEDLERALKASAFFQVHLRIRFDEFAEMVLFHRGCGRRVEVVPAFFGLWKRKAEVEFFERVVLYVQFKEEEYFSEKRRQAMLFKPGSTLFKLFRDVPTADLEMIFPNTEISMRLVDKLMIGVPAVVGGVGIVVKLLSPMLLLAAFIGFWLGLVTEPQVFGTKEMVALVVAVGTLGGYLFRQLVAVKNRRLRFMKELADNLYFRNLDNNVGVFHRLIDAAEEEESKEALLAYYFLLTEGPRTPEALDDRVEEWFEQKHGAKIDFEGDDALRKLECVGLARREDGRVRVLPLAAAKARLDCLWDNFFQHHHGDADCGHPS